MSLLGGVSALFLTSCKEETKQEVLPSISISELSVSEENVLTFKVTSSNAKESAYILNLKTESQPTEEEVLGKGTALKADGEEKVTVENLEPATEYVITAAAVSEDGLYATATESFVTSEKKASLGDPANTYIVTKAGTHSFLAKKVDGTDINIVSADWIWATKQNAEDTEQKLISNVSYKDGIVSFEHTGEKGNAVIAGFNDKGESVWTWLIWSTDMPEDIAFETGAVFQDRFIGATGATQESGKAACGVINYQWGRPVPIFGGYDDEWGENEVFNEARKWTVVNPKYPYEWKVEKKTVTKEESIAAPLTFFVGLSDYLTTWLNVIDKTLWQPGDKTNYDPCPAGYKLPQPGDWSDCMNKITVVQKDGVIIGGEYKYSGKTTWFPSGSNGRAYDTGENVLGVYPGLFMYNGSHFCEMWEFGIPGFGTKYDFPSRVIVDFTKIDNQSFTNSNSVGNASFAHTTRCVKM